MIRIKTKTTTLCLTVTMMSNLPLLLVGHQQRQIPTEPKKVTLRSPNKTRRKRSLSQYLVTSTILHQATPTKATSIVVSLPHSLALRHPQAAEFRALLRVIQHLPPQNRRKYPDPITRLELRLIRTVESLRMPSRPRHPLFYPHHLR